MKRLDLRAPYEVRKALRGKDVAAITVTVTRADGTPLVFDGDETSQQRLLRFALRAQANGRTSLPWKMADNSTKDVTPNEMLLALDLALKEQGDRWFI